MVRAKNKNSFCIACGKSDRRTSAGLPLCESCHDVLCGSMQTAQFKPKEKKGRTNDKQKNKRFSQK